MTLRRVFWVLRAQIQQQAISEKHAPLIAAAGKGHGEIVRFLLNDKRVDIEIDQQDEEARTALSWSAVRGHDGIVGLLLQH